jgi:beta-lactamase superfamily II metal-dependent hydrolase
MDMQKWGGGYNKEDWIFYKNLREGKYTNTKRLTYFDTNDCEYWNQENIKILCPCKQLLDKACECVDYNDSSYAFLFTPPKADGSNWKILFGGDTHDASCTHIIENYKDEVSNIDILFAPHHGRDSDRNYDFLKVLNLKVTLFGNASSKHLAYDCYPKIRLTNNQAGYIILNIQTDKIRYSDNKRSVCFYYYKCNLQS